VDAALTNAFQYLHATAQAHADGISGSLDVASGKTLK